ncbi:MAG: beta-galactosidase, partial [Bacteroidota bacterium]|nr:beta-galactosidase [Bacteroidota bacterium]
MKNAKKLKFGLVFGLVLVGMACGIRINCFANATDGLGWDYNLTKRCVKTTGNIGDENYYEDIAQCADEKHWLVAVESEKTFGASCPGPQGRSFIVNEADSPMKLNWESHQSESGQNLSVNMKTDMINYPHPCGKDHFTWFAFMDQNGLLPKPRELISSNTISYNDFVLPDSATRCIVAAQFFWDGKPHLIEIHVASTNWGDKDDHLGVIFSAKNILGNMDYLALDGSYFGYQLHLSEDSNWKYKDTLITIDWAPLIDFSINEGYFDAPTNWDNTATQSVQVASEVYNEAIADLWHTHFKVNSKSGYAAINSISVSNSNPKVGDTVKINYTVGNLGNDDEIIVACGPGYLPEQYIFSQYLQEKTYVLKNGEQKTDFCSFVVGEDLYQEQQNGKDVIGIVAGFHGEPKIWDETKYENITISPASSINSIPIGNLDSADQTQITGWVYDEDTGISPIDVHIYIDGNLAGSTTANQSRPDLVTAGVCPDPNHGFSFPTPFDLSVGEHTVNVYAINYPEGTNPELSGSPKVIVIEGDIADIEFIKIASDNWHFETANSKKSFVPFGCNYYDPITFHPEPFPAFDVIGKFDAVRTDRHFEQLANAGANIVRTFLSVKSFEPEFKQLDESSFQKLDKIIFLAKKHNLRIIFELVGFWEGGTEHICDEGYPCVPWLNGEFFVDETSIQGLEFLVSAFGKRYVDEPTIFAWNIINETNVPWPWGTSIIKKVWQDWVHSKYGNESALSSAWSDYPQLGENWNNIEEPENQNNLNNQRLFDHQLFREGIAYNWLKRLTHAIRAKDQNHLISAGNIQWAAPLTPTNLIDPLGDQNFSEPELYSPLSPQKIASLLDYTSIHGYNWWDSNTDNYINGLLRYSYASKPVFLGEFSYSDSTVNETLGSASGWLTWSCYGAEEYGLDWPHYLFNSNEQITNLGTAFKNKAPLVKDQTLTRLTDLEVIPLDMKKLLTDIDKQDNIYAEYIQKCNSTEDCRVGFTSICYPDGAKSIAGQCDISCGASAICDGITPGNCSSHPLKKYSYDCQNCKEVSSCKDGICNCGENPSNCPEDCNILPIGYLDSATQATMIGWAYDQNAGSNPIDIHIYIDGNFIGSSIANQSRSDIMNAGSGQVQDPNHGFSFSTPFDLSIGDHIVSVFAINYPEGTNPELIGSPTSFNISNPDPDPTPPSPPTPPSYPEQTLLKTPDSFKIYIIINQKKKWIPTPEVFETLGYQWTEIIEIEKNELISIPDYEDNLIRALNDYKVYLIVNGIKRHIPNPEIFLNYGFEWEEVKDVNQEIIDQYKMSLLIKQSGEDKIYYLEPIRKIKRWLRSPEIFNSYNNKWEDIQVISKYEMDSYPTSNLIKLNNSNDVYLIEGNKKRLINSVEEFDGLGLDWERVMG